MFHQIPDGPDEHAAALASAGARSDARTELHPGPSGPAGDERSSGADGPAADGPAADGPAADRPAADRPAADGPGADGPAADGPGDDRPGTDSPGQGARGEDSPADGSGEHAPGGRNGAGESGEPVTVVPGIARYHRASCMLIRFLGTGDLERMPKDAAIAAGLVPCKACTPDT